MIGVNLVTILVLSQLMKAEGQTFADLFTPFNGSDILCGLLFGAVIIVTWFPAAFIGNLWTGAILLGAWLIAALITWWRYQR
ncbi:hypothetical protein [Schaalia suimastitidis]|uniref:hypothetical protein n=1 Tax=Schaalia suimastitidis TaxID=121163 RepID=UPI000428F05C|nr:hypothetical protein [Schaalia suimastitidis]